MPFLELLFFFFYFKVCSFFVSYKNTIKNLSDFFLPTNNLMLKYVC